MDAPSTLPAPETHATDAMQVDLRPKTADKGKQKVYESVDCCDKDEDEEEEDDDDEEEDEEDDEAEADYDSIDPTDDDDDDDNDDADSYAMLAELMRLGNNIAEGEQSSMRELATAQAAFEAGDKIGFASQALIAVAHAKGWAWVLLALLPIRLGGSSLGMSEQPHPGSLIRVKCGEHDENGKLDGTGLVLLRQGGWAWGRWERGSLHGEGTFVGSDGSRYVGSWCHGSQHGKGVLTNPDGTLFDGNWANGRRHGQGVAVSHRGRQRTSARWKAGNITGDVTTTVCACFDLSANPVKQLQHHAQSPALCHPFGLLVRETYKRGQLIGRRSCLWSNGDTMYTESGKKGDDPAGWPHFRMSPECPDERFRGKVIEGVPWLYPRVTRADGSLTYVLEHPDPAAAPEAFCFYYDYYTQGHLPVEDRDRADISALLNRAAQRLPAPFLSLPSSSSSSSSSALAFSSF
jgi:hypothetical protein